MKSFLIVPVVCFLGVCLVQTLEAAPPASAMVDRLVEAKLAEEGIEPNPLASDEVFVRRIYLDVLGRIPTYEETVSFVSEERDGKRERLINRLLESEGYVLNFANYWADLLRAKDRISGAGNSLPAGRAYNEYIRESLRENKPYDELVHELLTASGNIWNKPQVGYYLRDFGMPLDNLAVTVQTFLGTRIVCAQCHDHPFDTWTQMDYYHLAAFTNGMVTTNQTPTARRAFELYAEREKAKGRKLSVDRRKEVQRAASEILKPVRFSQVYDTNRALRLPHDYQYDDAKPKSLVLPEVPFVPGVVTSGSNPDETPIHAFADWMTSPENPRFTRVIANRLWNKTFGLGLIEPIDDLREDTEAVNPALMKYLEDRMIALDYDMKKFLRILYNSQAYQREASLEQPGLGEKYYFQGPVLRRMSAEQIWDSFLTLTIDEIDQRDEDYEIFAARQLAEVELIANAVNDHTPAEFLRDARKIAAVQKTLADEIQQTQVNLAAAREAKDVEATRKAVTEAQRLRRELERQIEEIVYRPKLNEKMLLIASNDPEQLTEETFGETGMDSLEFLSELSKSPTADESEVELLVKNAFTEKLKERRVENEAEKKKKIKAWGIKSKEEKRAFSNLESAKNRLRRATYVGSPAPPGHFLREFGQSDRELVDGASEEAAVTQALSLLNGPEMGFLMNRYSTLNRGFASQKGLDNRLDYLYTTLLSRTPTKVERELMSQAFSEELGTGGMTSTIWTLLNTRQFLFIQ